MINVCDPYTVLKVTLVAAGFTVGIFVLANVVFWRIQKNYYEGRLKK